MQIDNPGFLDKIHDFGIMISQALILFLTMQARRRPFEALFEQRM